MRFVAPILAFCVAIYMVWYNQSQGAEKIILFPINHLFPEAGEEVWAQRSWQALVALGSIWLTADVISMFRRSKQEQPEE